MGMTVTIFSWSGTLHESNDLFIMWDLGILMSDKVFSNNLVDISSCPLPRLGFNLLAVSII